MLSSRRRQRNQIDSSLNANSDGPNGIILDLEKDDVKRKSRNLSEKKRRDQFNALINQLCSMLNDDKRDEIGSSANKKMDKSSVLLSTITFFKNHSEAINNTDQLIENRQTDLDIFEQTRTNSWKPSFLSYEEFSYLMLEALNAFIIIFEADQECHIVYASESILSLLGISPSHLMPQYSNNRSIVNCELNTKGESFYTLMHPSEQSGFLKLMIDSSSRNGYISTMIHFKQYRYNGAYELVKILGSYQCISEFDPCAKNCFVCICKLEQPKLLKELYFFSSHLMESISSKSNEFISRHSLEWKFLYLDHRASTIIGYLPFEVLGTSGYDYYHWDDLDLIIAGHQQLMQTGSGVSCSYRFLTKGQQWIWLKTRYFITYHMWNSKPEFIVCTHSVIGYDEASLDLRSKIDTIKSRQESPTVITSSDPMPLGYNYSPKYLESSEPCSIQSDQMILTNCEYDRKCHETGLNQLHCLSLSSPISSSDISLCNSMMEPTSQCINDTSMMNVNSTEMMVDFSNPSPTSYSIPMDQSQFSSISDLQDFLRRKHEVLEKQIQEQQEELKRVSEQLLMVQVFGENADDQNEDLLTQK